MWPQLPTLLCYSSFYLRVIIMLIYFSPEDIEQTEHQSSNAGDAETTANHGMMEHQMTKAGKVGVNF